MARDITDYLAMSRQLGASDLHLSVGAPPAVRLNGVLQPLEEYNLDAEMTKDLVYSVLSETQRAQLEKDWDVDFAVQLEGVGRFRGNAHFSKGRVEGAFRHVPNEIPDLPSLGHTPVVSELAMSRSGLLLVTGLAGMGKTATLAAMAKKIISERSCVVVSIEDPIEYLFDHSFGIIKQRQVGIDSKSFGSALRSALRQDPDVILVSEMRDLETISTALTAAETGHLVISTLHSIDAPKALDRIIDAFPADQQSQIRSQIANCLIGICSQRLLPRADAPGRVLATEILRCNAAVRSVIREGRNERLIGLMQIGAKDGMHTVDDSLAHLLVNGHISYDEAMANAREKEHVQNILQNHLAAQDAAEKKRR